MKTKPQSNSISPEVYKVYSEMVAAYTRSDNATAQKLAHDLLKATALDCDRLKDVLHVLKRLGAL